MATVTYVSYKSQDAPCMKAVINYVEKEGKVLKDGIKMIAGKDCVPENAYNEFMSTKNMYKKANGTFFYHFVQSFDPKENIEPLEVQAIGLELAEYFKGYEVLVATHFDKEHKHNHLIINSVSFENGKKFQGGPDTIEKLRELSDKICSEHGFSILTPYKQNKAVKGIGTRESRIAMKGESWKVLLMNIIDDALETTHNKEEFIKYMGNHGYQVNWTDSRKYITYTIPDGRKVRDIKLHDEKYLKENMEQFFADKQVDNDKNSPLHIETAILGFGHNDSDDYIFSSAPTDNLEGLKDEELLIAFKNRQDMQEHIKAYNELVEIRKQNDMNFEITISLVDEFLEEHHKNYNEEDEEDLEL